MLVISVKRKETSQMFQRLPENIRKWYIDSTEVTLKSLLATRKIPMTPIGVQTRTDAPYKYDVR